ncbi:MAG: type II CAAX prenyl endopeptidase Rce1 family protein, partial [Promethearchaeota archaeon]
PICNEHLKKIPGQQKDSLRSKVGYIFDSKKLRPVNNKDRWNFKEGIKIFESSILTYLMVYIMILLILNDPSFQSTGLTIFYLILEKLPHISLFIYPLLYIILRKDRFLKLGFDSKGRKLHTIFFFAFIGIFTLFFLNLFFGMLIENLQRMSVPGFINYSGNSLLIRNIINTSGFWFIFYYSFSVLSVISIEIAYRGVLHNALKDKFGTNLKGRSIVILIVSGMFAFIESLMSFLNDVLLGLVFLAYYFLLFLILGILYELKGRIYNTLITYVIFDIVTMIIFVFF